MAKKKPKPAPSLVSGGAAVRAFLAADDRHVAALAAVESANKNLVDCASERAHLTRELTFVCDPGQRRVFKHDDAIVVVFRPKDEAQVGTVQRQVETSEKDLEEV